MNRYLCIILFILSNFSTSCFAEELTQDTPLIPLDISSTAFSNEASIPIKYTCDGQNISPPFSIKGVKKEAKSLMLVAVDRESSIPPDQSVIWFVYNMAPNTKQIEENKLPSNTATGRNTDGSSSYQGPCPKDVGKHRYYFNLYALDILLPETVVTLQDAASLMDEHLIGYASLIGTYIKK